MKKLLALILALTMVFGLCACGQKETSSVSVEGDDGPKIIRSAYAFEQLTVGMTLGVDLLNNMYHEFNESQDELYFEDVVVYSADYEIQNQISQLEDALIKKYDILMIQSLDDTAVMPYLRKISENGTVVMDVQGTMVVDDGGDDFLVHVVACDHAAQGKYLADDIKAYLNANPDVHLNMGLVWHDQSVTAALARIRAIKELSEEMPDRITVLAEVYTSETAVAQSTMEDWIQAYPEMNYVACSMDESALGIYNALKAAGKKPGEVMIGSIDGDTQGCTMILEGYMTHCVAVSVTRINNMKAEAAFKVAKGEIGPGDTIADDYLAYLDGLDRAGLEAHLVDNGWLTEDELDTLGWDNY